VGSRLNRFAPVLWPSAELARLRVGGQIEAVGRTYSTESAARASATRIGKTLGEDTPVEVVVVELDAENNIVAFSRRSALERVANPSKSEAKPCVAPDEATRLLEQLAREHGCTTQQLVSAHRKSHRASAPKRGPVTAVARPAANAPLLGVALDTEAALRREAQPAVAQLDREAVQAHASQIAARRVDRADAHVVVYALDDGTFVFDAGKSLERLMKPPAGFEKSTRVVLPPIVSGDDEQDAAHSQLFCTLADGFCGEMSMTATRKLSAEFAASVARPPVQPKARTSKLKPQTRASEAKAPPKSMTAGVKPKAKPSPKLKEELGQTKGKSVTAVKPRPSKAKAPAKPKKANKAKKPKPAADNVVTLPTRSAPPPVDLNLVSNALLLTDKSFNATKGEEVAWALQNAAKAYTSGRKAGLDEVLAEAQALREALNDRPDLADEGLLFSAMDVGSMGVASTLAKLGIVPNWLNVVRVVNSVRFLANADGGGGVNLHHLSFLAELLAAWRNSEKALPATIVPFPGAADLEPDVAKLKQELLKPLTAEELQFARELRDE
jgi:hypothetical protein